MRRFLDKLAAMGERTAPGLWATLCVLLWLALCLDAVWWRSLPLGVALLGLALLLSGGVGWMVGAEKLRTQNSCTNLVEVFLHTNPFRPDLPQYKNVRFVRLPVASNSTLNVVQAALRGLQSIYRTGYQYKKAGVIVSGLVPSNTIQYNLFHPTDEDRHIRLMNAMDKVNDREGRDVLRVAEQGFTRRWTLRQERLSPCYTTRWADFMTITV